MTITTMERAAAGVIVTFVNTDNGEEKVIHRGGYSYDVRQNYEKTRFSYGPVEIVHDLCNEADMWDGNWKVRTISSPSSILADLTGANQRHNAAHTSQAAPSSFEAALLARAGRSDMWEGTHHSPDKHRRRK